MDPKRVDDDPKIDCFRGVAAECDDDTCSVEIHIRSGKFLWRRENVAIFSLAATAATFTNRLSQILCESTWETINE